MFTALNLAANLYAISKNGYSKKDMTGQSLSL